MALDDPPCVVICKLLADLALVSSQSKEDWFCYTAHLPDAKDTPINAVAVYDIQDVSDGRLLSGTNIRHYGTQIRVQGRSYSVTYSKIKAIWSALEGVLRRSVTVNGNDYEVHSVSFTSSILPLGQSNDSRRRETFTLNAASTIKQTS